MLIVTFQHVLSLSNQVLFAAGSWSERLQIKDALDYFSDLQMHRLFLIA